MDSQDLGPYKSSRSLVKILNEIDNKKLTRMVACTYQEFRQMYSQLFKITHKETAMLFALSLKNEFNRRIEHIVDNCSRYERFILIENHFKCIVATDYKEFLRSRNYMPRGKH